MSIYKVTAMNEYVTQTDVGRPGACFEFMLVVAIVWVGLYALRIIGVKPASLTQRLMRRFRNNPIGSAILAFFFLAAVAIGGSKGPVQPPPAITSIWHKVRLVVRTPESDEYVIVPGSYVEVRTITEIRDPEPPPPEEP